jgi:hypothetical protein
MKEKAKQNVNHPYRNKAMHKPNPKGKTKKKMNRRKRKRNQARGYSDCAMQPPKT